ncbi:MAG TPA: arginine--tRNA ligase, partial [Acidocella sp.]|nr:arginine--tRNA ligase [Acidocella sp.]
MTENLFAHVRSWVLQDMSAAFPGLPTDVLAKIEVAPSRDAAHGDMATNAAMVAAKPAGKNPREIAALLVDALVKRAGIAKAEAAGPGFVNITLEAAFLLQQIPVILAAK